MSVRDSKADLDRLRALCAAMSRETIALRALRVIVHQQRSELRERIAAAEDLVDREPVNPWPPEAFEERLFGAQRAARSLRNQQRRELAQRSRQEAREAAAREAAAREAAAREAAARKDTKR